MINQSDIPGEGEIRRLRSVYRSTTSSLAQEFFAPCLRHATTYCRAAGYFSSTALVTWSDALVRMVGERLSIRLLVSPVLSSEDADAISAATDEDRKRALLQLTADRLVADALRLAEEDTEPDVRLRLLMWAIAAGCLELRFAIPRHVEDAGIFHEKSGIFEFPWGDCVAFSGSANETGAGHVSNYEKLHVFRSWERSDAERVTVAREDFERQWSGGDEALTVVPLSMETLALIKERAPRERPRGIAPQVSAIDRRWRHQQEAAAAFLKSGRGILEMATGTGKTSTALLIAAQLLDLGKIGGLIVATDGNDLLDQWGRTLLTWAPLRAHKFRLLRHYGNHHQGHSFTIQPSNCILLVSRQQLDSVVTSLDEADASRLMIVHDEVHGLGTPSCLQKLKGTHAQFAYTLGLSATPEREYDAAGSAFIESEIGRVVYRFGLQEAIERGILVEFDYVPLKYELTEEDRKRLAAVYRKQKARAIDGNPMAKEELWTELARVYKTAEEKPFVFADFLQRRSDVLFRSILFIEERAYGEPILETIDRYTHRYRTYYADDDREHLVAFARGETDCLITCHRISQGIDIRDLRTVVLFSSARAKLETIQRIGRCLRSDPLQPSKRAIVIDFVRDQSGECEGDSEREITSADQVRQQWLSELSAVHMKEQ